MYYNLHLTIIYAYNAIPPTNIQIRQMINLSHSIIENFQYPPIPHKLVSSLYGLSRGGKCENKGKSNRKTTNKTQNIFGFSSSNPIRPTTSDLFDQAVSDRTGGLVQVKDSRMLLPGISSPELLSVR